MAWGIRKPGTKRTTSYQGIGWVWINRTPVRDFPTEADAREAAEALSAADAEASFEAFELPDDA